MDVERAVHVIEIKGHPYNHTIRKSHSNFTSIQKEGHMCLRGTCIIIIIKNVLVLLGHSTTVHRYLPVLDSLDQTTPQLHQLLTRAYANSYPAITSQWNQAYNNIYHLLESRNLFKRTRCCSGT